MGTFLLNFQEDIIIGAQQGVARRRSATEGLSPVTAAFVVMLRSARPGLRPADVKRILMETSPPMTLEDERDEDRSSSLEAMAQNSTRAVSDGTAGRRKRRSYRTPPGV